MAFIGQRFYRRLCLFFSRLSLSTPTHICLCLFGSRFLGLSFSVPLPLSRFLSLSFSVTVSLLLSIPLSPSLSRLLSLPLSFSLPPSLSLDLCVCVCVSLSLWLLSPPLFVCRSLAGSLSFSSLAPHVQCSAQAYMTATSRVLMTSTRWTPCVAPVANLGSPMQPGGSRQSSLHSALSCRGGLMHQHASALTLTRLLFSILPRILA